MMIPFVVSFISGVVFEKVFGFDWGASVLVFLISLFLFFYFRKEDTSFGKVIFVIGAAFFLGSLRMNFVDTSSDPNLYKLVGQKISFEATVSQEPDVRDISARYIVKPDQSKSFVLLVSDRFPEFKY